MLSRVLRLLTGPGGTRSRVRGRATFFATLVVIASITSVLGASLRIADAVLGVAFARACAAETAAAGVGDRPRLRVDREELPLEAAPALAAAPDAAKLLAPSPERSDRRADLHRGFDRDVLASLTPEPGVTDGSSSPSSWSTIGPPTRGRARLMVFLN